MPACGPATVIDERVVKEARSGSPAFGLGMIQPVFQLAAGVIDTSVLRLIASLRARRMVVNRSLLVVLTRWLMIMSCMAGMPTAARMMMMATTAMISTSPKPD